MDRALGGTLSAFEAMWRSFYQLVTTAPAHGKPPISQEYPYYVLIECLGSDQERDTERFSNALESAMENGLVVDAAVAQSGADCAAFWSLRDDVEQVMRNGAPVGLVKMQDYFAARPKIEAIVYGALKSLRGSVSAEHGIGLEKKPWLSISRSETEMAMMRAIKTALDPKNTLSPGNIF